ncbi:phylloplanin [Ricinus communis]|uniref:Phylloplanin, putative n=1 Tax=Ricinus communis TaxID=3988 RepID=B9RT72_RICCO|nr:phylloplanin [Ricinus communis]EEF45555.1 Phylloplanin precursor, putative [Ricinus communis]|eukprot:XP_002516941.1 phylloplanin [Ricinus communis]
MALKSFLLVFFLVAVMAATITEAQLGIVGGLLGLIRIQGTVFCTANGNMGANGTATPVFPNAQVQLMCGSQMISTATTNRFGIFSIVLDPLQYVVSSVLSGCFLKVGTPLSNCDSSLPTGGLLQSPLELVGSTIVGILRVINIIPTGFLFMA